MLGDAFECCFHRAFSRQIVETVGNSNIFHNVCLVKDVRTGCGNVNINYVGGAGRRSGFVGHLLEETSNLLRREVQPAALVDEGNFRLGGARCNVRNNTSFAIMLRNNLDGLNTVEAFELVCHKLLGHRNILT